MWSVNAGDAANGIRAQLVLALQVSAVFPMFLFGIPPRVDKVALDLAFPAEDKMPWPWAPTEPQVMIAQPHAPPPPGTIVEPAFWPVPDGRQAHRLDLTPSDVILLDGRRVDPIGLRMALDRLALARDEWVDIRPDPRARYELFHEVLAVIARSGFDRLFLDNRPFRSAIDETWEKRPLPRTPATPRSRGDR